MPLETIIISPNKVLASVNNELAMFADGLIPSNEGTGVSGNSSPPRGQQEVGSTTLDLERMSGTEIVNEIFKAIRSKGVYRIPKTFIGGSVGKNTSVLFPDFDGVIFINNLKPPLNEPIRYFFEFFKLNAVTFGILPESISYTSNSVYLEFKNGMEMDLLPAAFFDAAPEKQRLKVHEEIKTYPEKYLSYSSSLVETQISFLTEHTSPVHQAIRLLKFWYKSLTFDDNLYGGSFLMEIICVAAWHEIATTKVYEIFRKALEKVADIDNLRIAFLRKDGRWKLLTQEEIAQNEDNFAPYILARPNYVIDPSNPYNDLIKNVPEETILYLKVWGNELLSRVRTLESPQADEFKSIQTDNSAEPTVRLNIQKIFEPHMLNLRAKYSGEAMPIKIIIHYDYMNYEMPNSKLDFNNEALFLDNPEAKKVARAVKTNLVTLIRLIVKREGTKYLYKKGLAVVESKDKVKEEIVKLLDINFVPSICKWSATKEEHQNCDATMLIPYIFKDHICAIKLSMKWSELNKNKKPKSG